MKKPKKTGSDYCNYKGFFSLVLLALVDAEYGFLFIDLGSNRSCSDAQIFNRSLLREKIEDGSLGLPPPEHLGEGGPHLHYILLGDDAFALMPWMVKPYSRRQVTREKRIANQCFRLRTNVRKFTPKSSDLRTYYLPGGQTDAEVFVERNIDISSIYEAIIYLFQFQKQKWPISCCLLVTAHACYQKVER